MDVQIDQSWKEVLGWEFSQPYFQDIKTQLMAENQAWKIVYPAGRNIFAAFDMTPFDRVQVVILGQDPYHGVWQAHGLSFSVPDGVKQPPSLKNIFKELYSDIGCSIPVSGNLSKRAQQWVLLLNAMLTVRAGEPGSHQDIGWQQFTDAVIRTISAKKECVVFLLWGAFAQSKKGLIDNSKHLILEAAHPSPFSAHRGFFGCQHFSKVNEYLISVHKKPIDWCL
jgi:uracil-DNA glycosylase